VCCCLSFVDLDLDLSLFLRFGFYRSHLFTNFRFSTVFISRSGAHRLDSSWLECFLYLRGIRLGSWCFSLTPGCLVPFDVGVFWISPAVTLSLVREFSPAHEKSPSTRTPLGPSSCRAVYLAGPGAPFLRVDLAAAGHSSTSILSSARSISRSHGQSFLLHDFFF
jgi:hypothetical protein